MNRFVIVVPYYRTLSHFHEPILARNKYPVKSHLAIWVTKMGVTGE